MPTFTQPNSEERAETPINEAWSDAARASAAASRGSRGMGTTTRKAVVRAVYKAARGKTNPVRDRQRAAAYQKRVDAQNAENSRLMKRGVEMKQKARSAEISSDIGGSKRRKPIEKVKVDRHDHAADPAYRGKTSAKFVRRHAATGKGSSKTYSNITPSSRGRLERALGSGAKGFYFTGRKASQSSGMGRDENRGATKTGMISYSSRRRKKG